MKGNVSLCTFTSLRGLNGKKKVGSFLPLLLGLKIFKKNKAGTLSAFSHTRKRAHTHVIFSGSILRYY